MSNPMQKNTITEQLEVLTALLQCRPVIVTSAGGAAINPPKQFTAVHGKAVGTLPDFEKYRYEVERPRSNWVVGRPLAGGGHPTFAPAGAFADFELSEVDGVIVMRQLRPSKFEFVPWSFDPADVVPKEPQERVVLTLHGHFVRPEDRPDVNRVVDGIRARFRAKKIKFRTAHQQDANYSFSISATDLYENQKYRVIVPTRQFVLVSRECYSGSDLPDFTIPPRPQVKGDVYETTDGMLWDVHPV